MVSFARVYSLGEQPYSVSWTDMTIPSYLSFFGLFWEIQFLFLEKYVLVLRVHFFSLGEGEIEQFWERFLVFGPF